MVLIQEVEHLIHLLLFQYKIVKGEELFHSFHNLKLGGISLLQVEFHVTCDVLIGVVVHELERQRSDAHIVLEISQIVGSVNHLGTSMSQIEVGGSHVKVGAVVELGGVVKITNLNDTSAYVVSLSGKGHCSDCCQNHVKFFHFANHLKEFINMIIKALCYRFHRWMMLQK